MRIESRWGLPQKPKLESLNLGVTAFGTGTFRMTSPANALNGLIDQYLNYLLVGKGLSRATLESYSHDLLTFTVFLDKNGQHTVSEDDTALILNHLITLRNG